MGSGDGTQDVGPGIPAATLILFSDHGSGVARHLMIQRAAHMRFAPDALVFPGGRVDEDDVRIAGDENLVDVTLDEQLELAHRVAAIRETLEEVGVIVGCSPAPDACSMQAALKNKTAFSTLLAEAGVRLDLSALVPWAKWHPRFQSHRRFDTRFYIARHDGDQTLSADLDEVGHARWVHARDAIAEAEDGSAKIIFPTLCNLERLAAYPTFEAAKAHVETVEARPISTYIEEDEQGEKWVCIPPDSGYPVTRQLWAELLAP